MKRFLAISVVFLSMLALPFVVFSQNNNKLKAVLFVQPAREPVAFDALLKPTSLQYSVSRQRGRA
jgi:hypothetical protein